MFAHGEADIVRADEVPMFNAPVAKLSLLHTHMTKTPSMCVDVTKVSVVVQGFPPDATASDIRTYFTTSNMERNMKSA